MFKPKAILILFFITLYTIAYNNLYKKNKTNLETLQHDISISNPMSKKGFHLNIQNIICIDKNVLHFLKRYIQHVLIQFE